MNTTSTTTLEYEIALERGDETTKRTLSVPAVFLNAPTQTQINNALSFANWAISSASTFIQTSTWRDNNSDEDLWLTTSIVPTFKSVTEYQIESDDAE